MARRSRRGGVYAAHRREGALQELIVTVLGSAAGGGVPQWNCGCANCIDAREGRAPRRTQSSLAVSTDGDRWLLVNVSPDVSHQITAMRALWPRTRRGTPIAGAVFTDANVDHVGGLGELRQDGPQRFRFYSSPVVKRILQEQAAFARFMHAPHEWTELAAGESASAIYGITFRAIRVAGTTPGYAGREAVEDAVYAFAVTDARTQRRALIAPVFADFDDALQRELNDVDVAFLDGTFYADDELEAGGFMAKTASFLGHAPLGGANGTLARVRNSHARIIFTHVNNTNPILRRGSPAAQEVAKAGCEIAYDSMAVEV